MGLASSDPMHERRWSRFTGDARDASEPVCAIRPTALRIICLDSLSRLLVWTFDYGVFPGLWAIE